MTYNPPTETQAKIRALAEKDNDISRAHFAERSRLRRKAELKIKLIKLLKIGIPILIIIFIVIYWVFLR
tara:strand:+ start:54 stop:260 length:207 start_codon:yes stop_codon:yes gene_type:complete